MSSGHVPMVMLAAGGVNPFPTSPSTAGLHLSLRQAAERMSCYDPACREHIVTVSWDNSPRSIKSSAHLLVPLVQFVGI